MESWELTEYDHQRKPQEITIDSELVISPPAFYREIMCPICQDILKETRAAPDCLHRFCKRCVDKVVKRECPVCHKKLPSQAKSFREDLKYDKTIALICNGYQEKQPETSRNNPAPDCEIVLKHLSSQQTRYIKCPEDSTVDHIAKYLSMRPAGSKMPDLNHNEEYTLCIVANLSQGRFEKLPGNLRLNEIRRTYKLSADRPLEFYFYKPSEQRNSTGNNN